MNEMVEIMNHELLRLQQPAAWYVVELRNHLLGGESNMPVMPGGLSETELDYVEVELGLVELEMSFKESSETRAALGFHETLAQIRNLSECIEQS